MTMSEQNTADNWRLEDTGDTLDQWKLQEAEQNQAEQWQLQRTCTDEVAGNRLIMNARGHAVVVGCCPCWSA